MEFYCDRCYSFLPVNQAIPFVVDGALLFYCKECADDIKRNFSTCDCGGRIYVCKNV